MLANLHERKKFRRMRASSYNPTGGNNDNVRLEPGAAHAVDLAGPGIVRHLWLTLHGDSPDLYRDVRLRLRCDSARAPQVNVPLADFFLCGHGLLADVDSAPIQVSRQPHLTEPPYRGGLVCLFPMPFATAARLAFENRGATPVKLYYYVDWEAHEQLAEPPLHFHATFHEEHTTPPAGQARQAHGDCDPALTNLGWHENYTFLDVAGFAGHYVGTGLSVDCRPGGAGKWWEGDDMFVIDGEPWPPRLHGTGTEDYFNLAWGFRQVACRPEHGVTFLDKREHDTDQIDGRFSMYRFHLHDPIPFTQSLLAGIEHGHANDCEAHYRSVAYWYGRELEPPRS